MSDELAEAERKLREFSGGNWIGDYFAENEAAGVVLKELDRLRADQPVVEAALAYVAAHTGPVSLSKDAEKAQAMVELIRVVKGRERGE